MKNADYGSNVWISKEVKKRLDKIRGDLSYSALIEQLLDGPGTGDNAKTVSVNGVEYVSVEAIKRIITEGLP